MWFSLFAVVLILAITYYQCLTGVFSAVIMCACTVLSAALAFGMYENVYHSFLISRQPDNGQAIAFMAVFLLALLIMRIIADLAIKKNMEFHPAVDRVGGGIFGFVTAMIIIGCLTIGFQMLPFYSTFLGYSRYTVVDAEGKEVDPAETDLVPMDWSKAELRGPKKIWMSPDGFTVSLVSHLSDNALAGSNSFETQHPDFLDELSAARWGQSPKSKHVAGKDALKVQSYRDLPPDALIAPQWFSNEGKKMLDVGRERAPAPETGKKWIAVRATLSSDARGTTGYTFNTWQVRLYGQVGYDVESYALAGVNDSQHPGKLVKVFPGQVLQFDPRGEAAFDFVFEVPDSEDFQPLYLQFKQNARSEMSVGQNRTEEPPPPLSREGQSNEGGEDSGGSTGGDQSSTGGSTSGTTGTRQDRISGVGPALPDTDFSDRLPLELTNYGRTGDFELNNGLLRYGHVTAQLSDDWQPIPGNNQPLTGLYVPSGQQLLQLSTSKLHAKSGLGRAIAVAVETMQDYYIVDTSGRNHRVVGAYAIAEVGGQKWFELVYLHEDAIIAGRKPTFTKIRNANLVNDYTLVYLFLMPPGTQPVRMHTGRTEVDLRDFNLVAPSNSPPS